MRDVYSPVRPSAALAAALAALAAVAIASVAAADITTTFDAGLEGWTLANGGGSLTWHLAQGNPGGAISGNDNQSNVLWYFTAPAAYRGDLSAFLGGRVRWDLRGITGGTAATQSSDVIIEGPAGRISFAIAGNIDEAAWQTFSVPLRSGGWFVVPAFPGSVPSSTAVSSTQFAAVLANVSGFYIQGEYRNGNDTAFLDNVRVWVPPPCGLSDVAGAGQSTGADGELTADDIIIFLNRFFAGDLASNVSGPGQNTTTLDGELTADDIIVFLNRYFAGC